MVVSNQSAKAETFSRNNALFLGMQHANTKYIHIVDRNVHYIVRNVVAMDLKSFTPTNGVVLPQRSLPRTKCIPRLIQTGSTRKRSTCFSPATIVLCLAVGARGRPQRAQRSAVCLMSIRDAREAIRDCLRENRTMPVLQALPEDRVAMVFCWAWYG